MNFWAAIYDCGCIKSGPDGNWRDLCDFHDYAWIYYIASQEPGLLTEKTAREALRSVTRENTSSTYKVASDRDIIAAMLDSRHLSMQVMLENLRKLGFDIVKRG